MFLCSCTKQKELEVLETVCFYKTKHFKQMRYLAIQTTN